MTKNNEIIQDLENDADDFDQVLNGYDEETEDLDEITEENDDDNEEISPKPRNPRGAGRPKGSKSKKRQEIDLTTFDEQDPFDFVKNYAATRCEPVELRIFRSGALLAAINFADDKTKIPFKSIVDLQKISGGGIYTFKAYSLTKGTKIHESKMQILDLPDQLRQENFEKNNDDLDVNSILSSYSNQNAVNRNERPDSREQSPIHVNVPPQMSLSQSMKELISTIAPLIPLIKMLIPQKNESMEMQLIKMQMEMNEKLEAKIENERRRLREERDELDRKVEARVAEKAETLGLQPEKSVLGEVVDAMKEFGGIVKAKAQVAAAQNKVIAKKSLSRKLPPPNAQTNSSSVNTPSNSSTSKPVEVLDKIDPSKIMTLDEIFIDIFTQVSEGKFTAEELTPYVIANPSLHSSIKSYEVDKITEHFKTVLKSTHSVDNEELFIQIDGIVRQIYDSI